MYAIARYLSPAARRAAGEAVYKGDRSPRNDQGYCPLGKALAYMRDEGTLPGEPPLMYAPSSPVVARVVLPDDVLADLFLEVEDEASKFTADWDNGLITNLREALGVDPDQEE